MTHLPPLTRYARIAVEQALAAEPGAMLTVCVPVGCESTQAMILSCYGAARPLIITRLKIFVANMTLSMQCARTEIFVPAYIRIAHPLSVTSELLQEYTPDRIIVHNPPLTRNGRWAKALNGYCQANPHVTVVMFRI